MLLLARETCLKKGAPWNIAAVTLLMQLLGSHSNKSGVPAKAPGAISYKIIPLSCFGAERS